MKILLRNNSSLKTPGALRNTQQTKIANSRVPSGGQPAREYASRGIKAKDKILFGRTEVYNDDLLLPLNTFLWHPSYKCTFFLISDSNIQNLF